MLLPPRPTPVDAFTNDEGLEASRKLIKHYVARMHCRTKKDHSLFSCPVPCKSGASGRSFEVAWNPDRRVGFGHPTCGGQIVYLRTSDSLTEKKIIHKKTAGATKIEGRWRCRFRRARYVFVQNLLVNNTSIQKVSERPSSTIFVTIHT
jgi:hypothetical protein